MTEDDLIQAILIGNYVAGWIAAALVWRFRRDLPEISRRYRVGASVLGGLGGYLVSTEA